MLSSLLNLPPMSSVSSSARHDTGNQTIKLDQVTPKAIANWIINKKVDVEKISPTKLIEQIVQSSATSSISDDELEKIIKQVLAENQKAIEDYKNGKEQALMFLVGQAMRLAKGKSSAEALKKTIIDMMIGQKEDVPS